MMPKIRAWIKEEKCFADYIETIRYYAKEIDLKLLVIFMKTRSY